MAFITHKTPSYQRQCETEDDRVEGIRSGDYEPLLEVARRRKLLRVGHTTIEEVGFACTLYDTWYVGGCKITWLKLYTCQVGVFLFGT